MKKVLPAFFLLLFPALAPAQTRTSIANGDWFNPATWSPSGVPAFTDATIIVNSQVTFSQNITLGGNTVLVKINPGASLVNTSGPDSLVYGCDQFRIEGYLSTGWLQGAANDSVVNTGTINVTQDVQDGGTFINRSTGSICISQQLISGDIFVNDGSIKTVDWVNAAAVSGNGRFCISGNFVNTAAVTGGLDICDSSPGGFGDINMGTIASTITNCAAAPCSACPQPTGIHETNAALLHLTLAPNPFSTQLLIVADRSIPGTNFTAELFDLNGRLILRENFTGSHLLLQRDELESGVYFLRVTSSEGASVVRKVIAE